MPNTIMEFERITTATPDGMAASII